MCPRVHFPLILQPLCCKTFTSSRHLPTYSLFKVGTPDSALSVFWLSIGEKICLFLVPDFRKVWSTSWVAFISPSSMTLLLPMFQPPWRRVFTTLSDFSMDIYPLEVLPSSFLEPSVYGRITDLGRVLILSVCSLVIASLLALTSGGGRWSHCVASMFSN